MAASWRHGILFGLGLLFGVLAGAALLAGFKPHALPVAAAQPQSSGARHCGFDAVLPAKEKADKFGVPMDASGKDAADVPAYIAVGEDARTQGRARDAEIAFITACRIAGHVKGPDSVEVADAKFHLAKHYAEVTGIGTLRAEALKRAGDLMSESVTTFGEKLGVTHEKTAFAAGGLARIKTAILEAEEPMGVPRVLLAERSTPDYGVAMVNTSAMGASRARKEEADSDAATAAPADPAPVAGVPPLAQAQVQPPNVPTCLGGDCPAQAQMVRERERDRDPMPAMQASRQLKLPEPARVAPVPQANSPAPNQAQGSATGSPGEPAAP